MLVDQLFTIPTSRRLDENTMSDQEILELFSTIDPFGARLANLKPTAATALGRAGGKLINYVGRKERDLRNKVTFSNIKKKWEQMGRVNDSEAVADFLAKQGVPQDKIDSAYSDLGISRTAAVPAVTAPAVTAPAVTAPTATGGAGVQTGDIYAIDPDTGKPYEKEKLAAKWATPAAADAPDSAAPPAPTPAASPTANTNAGGPGFNATNVMQMPGMEKYATPKPANTTNFGTAPAGYGKTTTTFKTPSVKAPSAPAAPAAPKAPKVTSGGPTPAEMAKYQERLAAAAKAQPVAETIEQVKKMLETVQTKDDIASIKKYINSQFAGQLNESTNAQRSHLLNEVTRIGAIRRRQHSRQMIK